MFYGRTGIPGVEPGARLRLEGKVPCAADGPAMINPAYQLLPKAARKREGYSPPGATSS